ncbi:hypothetical protein ACVWDN_24415, partial [Escherichia coli]
RKETLKSVFFRFGPGLRNGCQVSVSRPVALLVAGTLKRWCRYIKGPKQMKALNKIFGSLFMLVGALLASARHA